MTTRTQERGSNWTMEERNFLISLIEAKKEIIENKQSDYASVHDRNQAWLDIAEEYNVAFPPGREAQKIKEQYQRLKSNAKKEIMEYHKKARLRPPASPPSELSLRLSSLAPADFKPSNCCWETDSKQLSSSSEQNSGNVSEDGCNGTHMLVTLKTEINDAGGDDWESAETFHVVTNGSVSRRYSDITDVSNDSLASRSAAQRDVYYATGRSTERVRGQEPVGRKKALSVLERMSADRLSIYTEEKDHPVPKRRKSSVSDNQERQMAANDPLYHFHKAEHDLKMKHLGAEHNLRMEILMLKKQLLRKKIAALDLKTAEPSSKS